MKKAKRSPGKARSQTKMLTQIEKLDGSHPGLATQVRVWFDCGVIADDIPKRVREKFGVSITAKMAEGFRSKRWAPEKELIRLKLIITKAAIEAFGGDAGLDAVLLSKLWELMDEMTIPQILSARSVFVKVRAQNLKEQEFLFKTGQLKPARAGGEQAPDPETQQRNVLRRVKEIFGLATGDEPETPAPVLTEALSS